MIRIRNLKVDKAGKTICEVPKLDVERGQRVAVIGPNGSGKTTLLRVIGALETDFCGQCQIEVEPRSCVYVHQIPYMLHGSVLFNVSFGLEARGRAHRERTTTARQWLAKLGVEELASRHCKRLSGGERRRVALARALAIRPEILLIDEPFGDLDADGIEDVSRVITEQLESTILIASPVMLPDSLKEQFQEFLIIQ